MVTTLKNTVDHVVTDGASLPARPVARRAGAALIAIAHPEHRDALEREARDGGPPPR